MVIEGIKNIGKGILSVFFAVLYHGNFEPIWLRPVLFVYVFSLLLITHVLSTKGNDNVSSKKVFFIILTSVCLVEITNQISYQLSKKRPRVAARVKGILFWMIFTGGIGIYFYLISNLRGDIAWAWHENIPFLLINFVLSWILPAYSFSPNIRFLFLYGKFGKRKVSA